MSTAVAEPSRTVTPGRRDVLAKSFGDLSEALEHAVSLAAKRLGYSVTLRDGESAATGGRLQIVDQDHVFGDGQFGLAVVISCPTAVFADILAELRRLCGGGHCEPVAAEQGCRFAARFGTDLVAARVFVERLLPEARHDSDERFWTVIRRTRSAVCPCR